MLARVSGSHLSEGLRARCGACCGVCGYHSVQGMMRFYVQGHPLSLLACRLCELQRPEICQDASADRVKTRADLKL